MTLDPATAARCTTLRPTGRPPNGHGIPLCVGTCDVLANLGRWHRQSLGAAVYDTSTRRLGRGGAADVTTTRWTVVDTFRAADGSVGWLAGDVYPEPTT